MLCSPGIYLLPDRAVNAGPDSLSRMTPTTASWPTPSSPRSPRIFGPYQHRRSCWLKWVGPRVSNLDCCTIHSFRAITWRQSSRVWSQRSLAHCRQPWWPVSRVAWNSPWVWA